MTNTKLIFSQLLNKSVNVALLEQRLQENPALISEEGYDYIADDVLYEHTLIDRKAQFADMFDEKSKSSKYKKYIVGGIIGLILIGGFVGYRSMNNTSKQNNPTNIFVDTIKQPDTLTKQHPNINKQINPSSVNTTTNTSVKKSQTNNSNISTNEPTIKPIHTQNEQISNSQTPFTSHTLNNTLQVNTTTNNINTVEIPKPCPNYKSLLTIQTKASELEKPTGSLSIYNAKRGVTFSLDKVSYSTHNSFINLAIGTYTLYINDIENCNDSIADIIIPQTSCVSNYKQDFSLGYDTQWTIPIDQENFEQLQISTISKQIILTTTLVTTNDYNWNGNDSKGNRVPEGLYKVVVKYKNEMCIFNVSLIK